MINGYTVFENCIGQYGHFFKHVILITNSGIKIIGQIICERGYYTQFLIICFRLVSVAVPHTRLMQ
jgi:hypothetical protein